MALHIVGPGFSSLVRTVRLYCLEKGLEATYGMSAYGQPIALHGEAHRALHPFGQVPVLIHGERRVFETLAICRYLDRAFPPAPPEAAEDPAPLVDQWASALATGVDSCLVRHYLLKVAGPRPDKTLSEAALAHAQSRVEATLGILQAQLGAQAFLCGARFSLADALLAPMLDYLQRMPGQGWLAPGQPLAVYLERLRQRPSGQAVLKAPDFSELSG
ncbi:glutathione S-transferase family protein [Pseudomonas sp. RIT-PI-S]|uniref:glutathione S-transferase family protein n=1 Tax=Pseudomonas sp. RIT-PI-S TaxID=3035295 RepID=UPI0021DB3608|nr:glutathione S-transferase family protein [Pseudomonas sp. RIT-PI-S]